MADGQANFYNFSNMHIDLSKVSASQTVLEVFPELQHYKTYTEAEDIEIRLGFLMADPRGPFSTIKQFNSRLVGVCRFLKIEMEAPDNKLYEDVLNLRSENILKIWVEYLSSVFNHEWASWFSSSLIYYQMISQLQKPIDVNNDKDWDRRAKIEGRLDAVYKRMKAMEAIVFIDEEIKRKSFEAAKDKIENFPEKYADEASVI